jgi:hypothetical protein
MKNKTKMTRVLGAVIFALSLLGGSCANNPRNAAIDRASPIRTYPAKKPKWVSSPKSAETKSVLAFTGSSGKWATSTGDYGSRSYAQANGRNQVNQYLGELISASARTHAAIAGISADTLSPEIISQELITHISSSVVRQLYAKDFYDEVYLDNTNRESHQSYALMTIEKAVLKNSIDEWGREKAEEYSRKAAQEQDQERRSQSEKARDFFGSNLSEKLGL